MCLSLEILFYLNNKYIFYVIIYIYFRTYADITNSNDQCIIRLNRWIIPKEMKLNKFSMCPYSMIYLYLASVYMALFRNGNLLTESTAS